MQLQFQTDPDNKVAVTTEVSLSFTRRTQAILECETKTGYTVCVLSSERIQVNTMAKHMTFEDRCRIEQELNQGSSMAQIARVIGRDRSTVGREILKHRVLRETKGNACIYRKDCDLPKDCPVNCHPQKYAKCRRSCHKCNEHCSRYTEEICRMISRPPYVCNPCKQKNNCTLHHWRYIALDAQQLYERTLRDSREGITLTESQLQHIDDLISPLILQGQSIEVACRNHRDELPVCSRTIYSYVDAGLLSAKNVDLARKVRRAPRRKKSGPVMKVDKACHQGRTYEDFQAFMAQNPDRAITEGDSVLGTKGGKVLLTLLLKNCDVQLAFLRQRNDAASVSNVFRHLRERLGEDMFRRIFQVILVDRGSEFTDPLRIEADHVSGEIWCNVFYCDPQQINQKSNCERNHEFIRYVIPRGTSMDHLTQADIRKMMNHINSYPREKWNWRSPLEVFISLYGQEPATLLGLEKIDPDSILLKPELLK